MGEANGKTRRHDAVGFNVTYFTGSFAKVQVQGVDGGILLINDGQATRLYTHRQVKSYIADLHAKLLTGVTDVEHKRLRELEHQLERLNSWERKVLGQMQCLAKLQHVRELDPSSSFTSLTDLFLSRQYSSALTASLPPKQHGAAANFNIPAGRTMRVTKVVARVIDHILDFAVCAEVNEQQASIRDAIWRWVSSLRRFIVASEQRLPLPSNVKILDGQILRSTMQFNAHVVESLQIALACAQSLQTFGTEYKRIFRQILSLAAGCGSRADVQAVMSAGGATVTLHDVRAARIHSRNNFAGAPVKKTMITRHRMENETVIHMRQLRVSRDVVQIKKACKDFALGKNIGATGHQGQTLDQVQR